MIVDDGGYGMLRYDQDVAGSDRDRLGVDPLTPDFVRVAEAFGIRADAVDGLDDEVRRGARPPRRGP